MRNIIRCRLFNFCLILQGRGQVQESLITYENKMKWLNYCPNFRNQFDSYPEIVTWRWLNIHIMTCGWADVSSGVICRWDVMIVIGCLAANFELAIPNSLSEIKKKKSLCYEVTLMVALNLCVSLKNSYAYLLNIASCLSVRCWFWTFNHGLLMWSSVLHKPIASQHWLPGHVARLLLSAK